MEKVFYPSHYCFLGFQASFVVTLPHIWRVYITSQVYPLTPSYGSNWGHKIADFLVLPYIYTIYDHRKQNKAYIFLSCQCINFHTVCLSLASSLSAACFSFQKPFPTLYYKASDLLGRFDFISKRFFWLKFIFNRQS